MSVTIIVRSETDWNVSKNVMMKMVDDRSAIVIDSSSKHLTIETDGDPMTLRYEKPTHEHILHR